MCAIRYKTGCCVGVGGRACHLTCVLGSVPLKDFGPPPPSQKCSKLNLCAKLKLCAKLHREVRALLYLGCVRYFIMLPALLY